MKRSPKLRTRRRIEYPAVSGDSKEKLREEHEQLNPLVLKWKIDIMIMKIIPILRMKTIWI